LFLLHYKEYKIDYLFISFFLFQILSQIWQQVADQEPDYPLTIGEVFEYRKNLLGDIDTICNKLLYDIRARMDAVNPHHQSSFTNPIDELNNFPVKERDSSNLPLPTVATTDKFKNLNVYQDDDHMYVSVYSGEGDFPPMIPNHHANQYPPSRKLSSQYAHQQKPINNGVGGINQPSSHHPQKNYNNQTSSRKSVPANVQPSSSAYLEHYKNLNTNTTSSISGGGRNSSGSPMIHKTVTTSLSSKSKSMDSIANGRGPSYSSFSSSQQPLTRSKVKETDLDDF